MNKSYRLIWNALHETFVVVGEHVAARGKRSATVKSGAVLAVNLLVAGTALAAPPNPPAPTQLPTGGQVAAGSAAISQTGATLNINQASSRAVLNWGSFNVGAQATVNFNQPSATSATLNRVQDANPSQIFGRINANGQVFLTNASGIYFAPSASVNVGALAVTTHGIGNADFMAGNLRFTRDGAAGSTTGSVVNEGSLNAALGGYIALLAPEVRNQGVIVAQLGTVALAAGEAYTLNFEGGRLAGVQVEPAQIATLIENGNAVQAPGGLIILSAQGASALQRSAIQNTGTIEASGISIRGGRIVLDAGGGDTSVAGRIDASSDGDRGGHIAITGATVAIEDGARLTASGATGGGAVLVGGSWQNSDPTVRQAVTTTVAPTAYLAASATDSGDGGTVVAWSDIRNPDSVTRAYGRFEARGGPRGGDGGRIETSGHWLDTQGAHGSAAAPGGSAGLWLFDPYNITISNANLSGSFAAGTWAPSSNSSTILNTDINSLLNNATNVTISTGGSSSAGSQDGDITVSSAIEKSSGGTASLTLQAARHINLNASIASTIGALNLTLSAANATSATLGGIDVNANLSSNGGNILIGGGAGIATNGIGYALNRSAALAAVTVQANRVITSSGGDITINGKSLAGSNSGNYSGVRGGVYIYSGATILSGTGNVNITGESNGGIKTFGVAVEANSNSVTTIGTSGTSGNLRINGVNTTSGGTAEEKDEGALGLVNNGSIGRLSLLGSSVANLSVQVNGSTKLIGFTNNPAGGCVSGYVYCGTMNVPGANSSYLYAGYSVVSPATQQIVVQTNEGDKTYDGGTNALGLSFAVTGAPGGYSTSGLRFITPSKDVGAYTLLDNGNPSVYVSGPTTYAVGYYKGNFLITRKALTMSGLTSANKEYDGTTAAAVSGTAALQNTITAGTGASGDGKPYAVDSVSLTGDVTGAFNSKDVADAATVSFSGKSLTGTGNNNYTLTAHAGASASITRKTVTLAAVKTYDGSTSLTGHVSVGTGVDNETLSYGSATTSSKDVGDSNKYINAITLENASDGSGGLASNYRRPDLSFSNAPVTIRPKPLTVSGLSAANKEYDGTTTAVVTGTANFSGVIEGDTVSINTSSVSGSFTTKDVGGSKGISLSGVTLSGASATNYTVEGVAGVSASITRKALTISGNDASKNHDGLAYSGGNGANYSGFVGDETPAVLSGVLAYSGNSQGAIVPGLYVITPRGYNFGNYALTYRDGILTVNSAQRTPTSAPTSAPTSPPPLRTQSNTPQTNQFSAPLVTTPASEGVVVSLIRPPIAVVSGVVSVGVPKGTVFRGGEFSFALPAKIAEIVTGQEQVTTLRGEPLPSWLRYSPDTKSFTASAVPNGALPMQVLLITDNQLQTVIMLYERSGM